MGRNTFIHKFELFGPSSGTTTKIMVLPGSRILSIQLQRQTICLWAEVEAEPVCRERGDLQAPTEFVTRTFTLVMTGQQPPANCQHRATILCDNGEFVAHIYELNQTNFPVTD